MEVKFKYGDFRVHGEMTVDLKELCNPFCEMPISQVRKLLKLIFQNCDDETSEQVQQYLNKTRKKYSEEFKKIRNKGR
ncbi:MAG: hypothetical protein ACERKZ_02360 [Lachnotalea sp.]